MVTLNVIKFLFDEFFKINELNSAIILCLKNKIIMIKYNFIVIHVFIYFFNHIIMKNDVKMSN